MMKFARITEGRRQGAKGLRTIFLSLTTALLVPVPASFAPAHAAPADAVQSESRLKAHRAMADRWYAKQMTPRWPLPQSSAMTAEGTARPEEWTISTWGPVNRESSHKRNGNPETEYTGEFLMYWNRIPDFRITEYQVWPTEQGWIARIIYGGTRADGSKIVAHQADLVTVDDTGKVVRIEWYCDLAEWTEQVWSYASRLDENQVRTVLSKPDGFNKLIDIALGRAKYAP